MIKIENDCSAACTTSLDDDQRINFSQPIDFDHRQLFLKTMSKHLDNSHKKTNVQGISEIEEKCLKIITLTILKLTFLKVIIKSQCMYYC